MQKPFKYHKVLSELIKIFPFGFSRNPRHVVPLGTNTISEISRVLGIDGEQLQPYRLAVDIYMHSTAYLTQLALGKKRRTLWGEKFPADIPPIERESARNELQRRGVWSDQLEHIYRSKIGHFVQLCSNSQSKRTHGERHQRWVERLFDAGFSTEEIERIQTENIQTDDLDAVRRILGTA